MRALRGIGPAAVVVLVSLAACQSANPSAAPSAAVPSASSARPAATSTAAPGASDAAPIEPVPSGIVVGEGDFFLPDPAIGLAGLPSHTATLVTQFDGTKGGAASKWTTTQTLRVATDPAAGERRLARTGDIGPADPALVAVVDGFVYVQTADGSCTSSPVDVAVPPFTEPVLALGGLIGGLPAGHETVNGVEGDTFSFDASAMGITGDTTATGRITVATTGDFVIHEDATTTGGPAYFGDGVEGTLTTTYDLTDVGAPVSVDLPAACGAGTVGAPLPSGATVTDSMPGLLAYTTKASVKDILAFYTGGAAAAGWTLAQPPAVSDDLGIAHFTSATEEITVIAKKAGGGTTEVTVMPSRR